MPWLSKLSLLLLLVSSLGFGQQVTTGDDGYLQVREVGAHLKCQCGCGSTVASCNMLHCHFREEVNPQIEEGLKAGLSLEAIVEKLVAKYGSELRTAPVAEGFGLVGWAMPFVALALGLLIAPFVVWRWMKKRPLAATTAPAVDEKVLARYQDEIDKELAEVE